MVLQSFDPHHNLSDRRNKKKFAEKDDVRLLYKLCSSSLVSGVFMSDQNVLVLADGGLDIC